MSIQLYSEGLPVNFRAEPGTGWFVYCVERERIQQAALWLYGRPVPIPHSGAVSIQPSETDGRRVVATAEALFALGRLPPAWALDWAIFGGLPPAVRRVPAEHLAGLIKSGRSILRSDFRFRCSSDSTPAPRSASTTRTSR